LLQGNGPNIDNWTTLSPAEEDKIGRFWQWLLHRDTLSLTEEIKLNQVSRAEEEFPALRQILGSTLATLIRW